MIVVQSTFHLSADTRSEAIELMKNTAFLCRQEPGCLSYEYFKGVTDTSQVVLLQEWENADCLQSHYQTTHMEDFLGKLGNYLQSEVVTRSYASQDEPGISSAHSDYPAKSEQTIH